jgi:anti-sigma B factor antagonist
LGSCWQRRIVRRAAAGAPTTKEPSMEISQRTEGAVTIVTLSGEIDGSTAPEAQSRIVPLALADAHIVLDMAGVTYMSSAGLRMLLVIYRTIAGRGGRVVLSGLSTELQDTMSLTGFLDFFQHYDTLPESIEAAA